MDTDAEWISKYVNTVNVTTSKAPNVLGSLWVQQVQEVYRLIMMSLDSSQWTDHEKIRNTHFLHHKRVQPTYDLSTTAAGHVLNLIMPSCLLPLPWVTCLFEANSWFLLDILIAVGRSKNKSKEPFNNVNLNDQARHDHTCSHVSCRACAQSPRSPSSSACRQQTATA